MKGASFISMAILILAPLAGGWFSGLPPGFFSFPPVLTKIHPPPDFNFLIFSIFALLFVWSASLLLRPQWYGFTVLPVQPSIRPSRPFPLWFWAGLALNLVSWACAWGQFDALDVLNDFTFPPLWIGYILVVDGLVFRRTGSSRFSRSSRQFLLLFPTSALIWWYFEFINRFVKNWWYEGCETFGVLHYVLFATLSFSTVLPAILETTDLLKSFSWFQRAYASGPRWSSWPIGRIRRMTALGALGLVLLTILPNQTFWLTWLAPLAVCAGMLALAGERTPFDDLGKGNYTELFALSAAALVCGFFWEMWNYWSMPKWHYSVPYVMPYRLFEMPVVGFTGYLPFGPLCWCMWRLLQTAAAGTERKGALAQRATAPRSIGAPYQKFPDVGKNWRRFSNRWKFSKPA